MPENDNDIRELISIITGVFNKQGKLIGSTFEKQEKLLQSFQEKYEKAVKEGATDEYINTLVAAISKLSSSIESQSRVTSDFLREMEEITGGRTDLDKKVLEDIMKFRVEHSRLELKIQELEKQKQSEWSKSGQPGKKANRAEIQRINKEIDDVKNEKRRLIDNYKAENPQRNSYERKALNEFLGVKNAEKRKKYEESILKSEEAQLVNVENISKAEADSNRQLDIATQKWSIIKKFSTEVWGQLKSGGSLWLEYNAQAINDAKRLGMTSKEEAMGYMETLMENSKTLARNFGMTAEQAMKMQDAYVKVTGRAAMLTESQMEDIAAASKLIGEETVQSAIGIMDNMGSTSQSTMELLDKNFARAVNSGLDTVKASQEFVKNMTLANKLTFRNGVDGISKMTILSQRIRMNLQEVANVADKFSSIEGAIEGAARLQMLGGVGGLYGSNPMQMMYEALSDPEALFERMGKMFSQQAVFDRRTGEARIDPIQLQIMREQAKAMGMNPDEAIQSAKQQAKLNAIEGDFRMFNPTAYGVATEEQKAAVANKAEYDKELGTWVVKYLDERGKEQTANLQNITTKELEAITKDNIEPVEDIRTQVRKIAGELVGTKEKIDSMKDQWKTGIAQLIHVPMEAFDSIISWFNQSGIWKALVGGGLVTATGVLGYGALKAASLGTQLYAARLVKQAIIPQLAGHGGQAMNAIPGARFARARQLYNLGFRGAKTTAASARAGGVSLGGGMRSGAGLSGLAGGGRAAISTGAKVAGAIGSVVGGAITAYMGWREADAIKKRDDAIIGLAEERNTRFRNEEFRQRRLAAENRQMEAHSKAVGEGVGVAGGAIAGAALGAFAGPIGMAIGGLIGGIVGGIAGKGIGKAVAGHKDLDVIGERLEEINKSDEEENFRKIVLPVESIDYNVSLIANQLGVLSAAPARGNIYLEAETAGQIYAEGIPLQASSVNEVDTQIINANQVYKPTGPLTLNVNGSIDLNMRGTNIGKLTAQDFKKMFDNNPELQRQIAEIVTNRQIRNGNAVRYNNENTNNRIGAGYNQNTI